MAPRILEVVIVTMVAQIVPASQVRCFPHFGYKSSTVLNTRWMYYCLYIGTLYWYMVEINPNPNPNPKALPINIIADMIDMNDAEATAAGMTVTVT